MPAPRDDRANERRIAVEIDARNPAANASRMTVLLDEQPGTVFRTVGKRIGEEVTRRTFGEPPETRERLQLGERRERTVACGNRDVPRVVTRPFAPPPPRFGYRRGQSPPASMPPRRHVAKRFHRRRTPGKVAPSTDIDFSCRAFRPGRHDFDQLRKERAVSR